MIKSPGHSLFPTTRSILSATALATMVEEEWGLQEVRCQLIKAWMSDTYSVSSNQGTFVLRVYRHGRRTVEEIRAELELLIYLASAGIPVSVAIPSRTGEDLVLLLAAEGERFAALFTYAAGKPLDRASGTEPVRELGRITARLHTAADSHPRLPRRPAMDLPRLLDQPIAAASQLLPHRPDAVGYLQRVACLLRETLDALPLIPPLYGFCHGGIARVNIHDDGRGCLTLFDFDLSGPGWRAFDVGVFLIGEEAAAVQAFLEGYQEVRQLEEVERVAIPLFQAARHIWVLGTYSLNASEWGTLRLSDPFVDSILADVRELVGLLV